MFLNINLLVIIDYELFSINYKNHFFPILQKYIFPILQKYIFPILQKYIFPILQKYIFPILQKINIYKKMDLKKNIGKNK